MKKNILKDKVPDKYAELLDVLCDSEKIVFYFGYLVGKEAAD
jgi:hypothetical protein